MDTCPKCRSDRIHRSHTRSRFERLRRDLTGRAPFRCSACGWRGWGVDLGQAVPAHGAQSFSAPVSRPEPDLGDIDRELQRPPKTRTD